MVELRLAEELVAASVLEPRQRAQQDADGGRRDAADRRQVGPALVGLQVAQHGPQIGQIEQGQLALVGVAEHEVQALLLGVIGAQYLRQQLGAEVGHRRSHRHAGTEPAQRQELDRERCWGERLAQLGGPLRGRAIGRSRNGEAGQVALDVGHDDRHAGRRQLFGQALERLGLARAGRAGDQAVAVHHGKGNLHQHVVRHRAVVDAPAQLDRRPGGRIALRHHVREALSDSHIPSSSKRSPILARQLRHR
jgi:hypothetical protein